MSRDKVRNSAKLPSETRSDEYQPKRVFSGFAAWAITCVAVGLSLFHLYTAAFGSLDAVRQRSVHFAGLFFLTFLLTPATKNGARSKRVLALDIFLALCSILVGAYAFLHYNKIAMSMSGLTTLDVAVGLLAVVLVLEACRRVLGLPLTMIGLVFLLYAFFGRYAPEIIAYKGANLSQVANQMLFTTEGIFSVPLGISATYVAVFILFGAFLKASGAGDVLIQLAYAVVGHVRGGPAKIAVIASSLFGTVSGSSVANVVGTGTFTIPLMKSIGYEPKFAGAVEAVASTGGQIMPPIMGAAAFIIAETLGLSYWRVAVSAFVPALMYYLALFIMIDIEAVKKGIKGVPRDKLPKLGEVLRSSWLLAVPVATLIYTIGVAMMSAQKSAFLATLALFLTSFLAKDTRLNVKKTLEALKSGAIGMIGCAVACAGAGIIIGVITLSGLGLRLSSIMIELAGGNLAILAVLTMIACVILGMGVPATAAYILTAVMIAPAMVSLGVQPMAAHLFVFYFSIISMITPPVALAAYAGASIAGSDPMKTGYTAMWLGLNGFIIPFMFLTRPGVLLLGSTGQILWSTVCTSTSVALLATALQGHMFDLGAMSPLERGIAFVASLLLIIPGILTDLAGFAIVLALVVYHVVGARSAKARALRRAASA